MNFLKSFLRAPTLVIALTGLALLVAIVVLAAWLIVYVSTISSPIVRVACWVAIAVAIMLCGVMLYQWRRNLLLLAIIMIKLRTSLPQGEGELLLPGLKAPVTISFDDYGIPTISANSRSDAFYALGYATAYDRFFQMDFLRRDAAGRLSEIFGPITAAMDTKKRVLGLNRQSQEVVRQLADAQRELLHSYTNGVNAYLETMKSPPFEFLILNYRPEAWTMEDSMLVSLGMFQLLCGDESSKRMLAVMEKTLPPAVVEFLTPDRDCFSTLLIGDSQLYRQSVPLPQEALVALLQQRKQGERTVGTIVEAPPAIAGSNCWAVAKSKSGDGRAIVAADLHLTLTVPNIWYRVTLCYEGGQTFRGGHAWCANYAHRNEWSCRLGGSKHAR